MKKVLTLILSLIMILSMLAPVFTVSVFAADEKDAAAAEDGEEKVTYDYLGEPFADASAKLATMSLYHENDEYAIYGLEETGEVGILVKSTGQIMLTNPYDAASSKSSDAVKQQLLSQIILSYSDSTGTYVSLNSFADAAFASEETKQIKMAATRTGLRTDYTIGREAVKYIVPRQIEKTAFENDILSYFDENSREYRKLTAYYTLKDPDAPGQSQSTIEAMKLRWPITEKYPIYVLDSGVGNREMLELESYIKTTFYDDYSKVEEMYEMLDYVDTSAAPALFRFAIEYNLDDLGLEIRLPASSIRYDSSNYTLQSVKFLPYFCAGSNENTGFTFVPDGSGTITRFEDIANRSFTLTGRLYGRDYSFHSISGTNQETMRLPAFGVMENKAEDTFLYHEVEPADAVEPDDAAEPTDAAEPDDAESTDTDADTDADADSDAETEPDGEPEVAQLPEPKQPAANEQVTSTSEISSNGYVAYLVEGDAMAEITADHGGTVHRYSSVYLTFYPKPSDSYVLDGISTSGSATWTVQSDRRYTGNYTLRVFPISGKDKDYTDMAAEIRNYLVESGTFEKMTAAADKSDDVPLYLETFGTIETMQKIAGFPVDVQTPLTTFEQTEEILTELRENGVSNVNVRMTGWNNGGLYHTAPAKLKIEKVLGGKKGFEKLAEYAKTNNVGLYPDLDFVYVNHAGWFDGFDYKDDTVKTIDNRSAIYREYLPLYQGFAERGSLILSPTAMEKYYTKIREKLLALGAGGLSVGTLGSELSSDHNEDYTLNREDVKTMIASLLSELKQDNGNLMISGGNAYALPYADHILGVSLDSSLNINTSESIPFVGMVLHGNVEFAGSAINLDGDYDYSVLKAIENGANLYYILSKDNTSELKQFGKFSRYYAISYDIWHDDLIDTYAHFNEAMKKVKYSYLVDHEKLDTRVVRVVYENGVGFLLNYNTHDVTVGDVTVGAMGYYEFNTADEPNLVSLSDSEAR